MSRRTILLLGAGCALLIALGGVLVGVQAQSRAVESVTQIAVNKGIQVAPRTLRAQEQYLSQAVLWQSMRTGTSPENPRATMVADGEITTHLGRNVNLTVLFVESRYGWFPSPTTLPFVAGLVLLIGMLFAAAARWRPRSHAS